MNNEMTGTDARYEILTLSGILVTLGRGRFVFFAVLSVGLLIAAVVAGIYPQSYVSSTVILPPQQGANSASNMLAQLGGVATMAPLKTPDELYVALMNGRYIQTEVIKKNKLLSIYETDSIERARKILAGSVSVTADKKSGLITVEVENKNGRLAADIANSYAQELKNFVSQLAVSEAQKRRVYFEALAGKARSKFIEAEKRFRVEQARSGWSVTEARAGFDLRESGRIRSQIAAKEVELKSISRYATGKNSDAQRVSVEISALRDQLERIESGSQDEKISDRDGGTLQAFRDMKVQEALLESATKQLEMARADEAKEGPLLQQIDIAIPAEKGSRPRKLFTAAAGATLALLAAFVFGMLTGSRGQNSQAWDRIRLAWGFKVQSR